MIPYRREMSFEYGRPDQVSPLIRRVVAENPGAFTYFGTGTYIVGHGKVAVIDPGPLLAPHLAALQAALAGEEVTHILITHTHSDHSPAAGPLKEATGARTYGFGPHGSGRPEADYRVEEEGDRSFHPDERLVDGDCVAGPDWRLEALHTPGHTSNHLCFALLEEKALFTGDHVMGWSTSVISPPDGDMAAYLRSLNRLLDRDNAIFWPTHGPPIPEPQPHVEALITHREEREAAILACLAAGTTRIPDMVAEIYQEVPIHLHPAAGRSVLAHLIHLVETGRAACDGPPRAAAEFHPR